MKPISKREILNIEYKKDVAIKEITTYKTDGYVKGMFLPKTQRELIAIYKCLKDNNIPFIVVGNGSNLLISPNSNILAISTKSLKQKAQILQNLATFSTSTPLAKAFALTSKQGLKGFEKLAGIPASIGGAIKNNAGAFGCSIFDNLEKLKIFDGKIKEIKKQDIAYAYHSTKLKDVLILQATFKLSHENPCKIMQDFLNFQQLRLQKQPKGFSCGSVFKNPPNMPAGYLIEKCGLKGKTIGNAIISPKHANFIINQGNATFDDITSLINLCKTQVKNQFNINLDCEVEIIE